MNKCICIFKQLGLCLFICGGRDVAMRKTGECTCVNEKNKVMVTTDQFT